MPLFSTSFCDGVFPSSQKCAVVTPLLKKVTLDQFELVTIHQSPVSHSPPSCSSTVRTRRSVLICNRIVSCLSCSQPTGAATPQKRPCSRCYVAADTGHVTLLSLLNLSTAFDTVDHHILTERLQRTYSSADLHRTGFSPILLGVRSSCGSMDTCQTSHR